MENKMKNILISEEQIKEKITSLGNQISKDYADKKLYVLSLLRGSFIFTADLVRCIDVPTKIGFITTSSAMETMKILLALLNYYMMYLIILKDLMY